MTENGTETPFESKLKEDFKGIIKVLNENKTVPVIMEAWILNIDEMERSVDFVVLTEGNRTSDNLVDISRGFFDIFVTDEIEKAQLECSVRLLHVYPGELSKSPYHPYSDETISIEAVAIRDEKAIQII